MSFKRCYSNVLGVANFVNTMYNKDMKTREIEVIRLITDEARKKRLEYQRAYRERNREKIKAYQRDWHKANPEKNKEYVERHWNKVAEGANQ